jgi:hypothetical protein
MQQVTRRCFNGSCFSVQRQLLTSGPAFGIRCFAGDGSAPRAGRCFWERQILLGPSKPAAMTGPMSPW